MTRRFLIAAATGAAGLLLGAGIGAAAAGPGSTGPGSAVEAETMDEMHELMRAQMPDDLVAQCDAMHESMPDAMGSMDPGSMGSMMGGSFDDMDGWHAQHHG